MNTSSWMACGRAVTVALVAGASLACLSFGRADASSAGGFALRNHNPFLQVFGLPAYQSARLTDVGEPAYMLTLDLANHADAGQSSVERFSIDGESYFLTFSLRRRTSEWFELGLDIPLVSHADGFMDGMIRGWHDMLGISNSKRPGANNDLEFIYERNGAQRFALDSPTIGLGDIQLSAGIPIRKAAGNGTLVTLRACVKLPTGDPDRLLGSGAADLALGLYLTRVLDVHNRDIQLSALAGTLLPGDGDVLSELQRDAVAFAGASASWQVSRAWALTAQVYGQSSFFRSDLDELGGKSLQLALGTAYQTRRGTLFRVAIVEDVSANATTDFALHVSAVFDGQRR